MVGVVVLVVGLFVWSRALQSADPDIVSRNGLHWHPRLAIYAKGERIGIPANIGLGAVHQSIHTHEDALQGVLHLEFSGVVRKQDLRLGNFFRIWGKDFMEFGPSVTMTVNGEENTERENYEMKDGDIIELRYE